MVKTMNADFLLILLNNYGYGKKKTLEDARFAQDC